MKLCISASDKELDARVDPAFGRAPYFHIFDTETMAREVIQNPAVGGQGAGIATARMVADQGTQALLTGVVGPNALDVLQASNITVLEGISAGDSVQEALARFMRGEFSKEAAAAAGQGINPDTGQSKGLGTGQCRAQGGQGRGLGMGGGKGRCRR